MKIGARLVVTVLITLEHEWWSSCLFFEEKCHNQEINRNDVDGGEKIVSF